MIAIDHVAVLARDVAASARFLAEILGLPPGSPDGPDGEMFRLPVDGYGSLLYFPADHVPGQHIAFRVDEATFRRRGGLAARWGGGLRERPCMTRTRDCLIPESDVVYEVDTSHSATVVIRATQLPRDLNIVSAPCARSSTMNCQRRSGPDSTIPITTCRPPILWAVTDACSSSTRTSICSRSSPDGRRRPVNMRDAARPGDAAGEVSSRAAPA